MDEWWDNRVEIKDEKIDESMTETWKSRLVSVKEIADSGYSLDFCGYPVKEKVILSPEETITEYISKKSELEKKLAIATSNLKKYIEGDKTVELQNIKSVSDKILELDRNFPTDMRDALLQAAMQGKLTEQLDTDSSVDDLIEQIKAERQKLEVEGKVKKSKGKKKGQQNDYFVDLPKDEYPYEIPENWKITNIQNVCTLYTGNSISESIKKSKYTNLKEGYNYIGTKDVEFNRTINYENGVKIPFSEEKFVYSYPNSTLLCIEGGSAGRKIAITKEKICFGNKLCTFNPISINYKFLYYYLQSPLFLSAFNNSLSGIITGVSLNKIKELNFVIPPIEEQQRIVEILDRLLPLCETL